MSKRYLECCCCDPAHILRFDIYDKDVIVSTHLARAGFFARIKNATKYIFGHRCKYGCFNETVLTRKQIEELRDICDSALDVI